MRILFVNATAAFQGGIEANVHATAAALKARGHEVALAHQAPEADPAFAAPFDAVFSMRHRTGCRLGEATGVWAPDLLYVHKCENVGCLRPWQLPVPVVRMVHDHDLYCQRRHRYPLGSLDICTRPASLLGCLRCGGFVERDRSKPLGVGWRPITARLLDLSATAGLARVLVASQAMATELRRNKIPPELVRVVPLGVPDDPAQAARVTGRYSRDKVRDETRVLFVGQVLRTKGLDLLLRALAASREPWRLSIVGTGAQEREFRALARELGVAERTSWHGPQPAERVSLAMEACDVVVVPSRWPEPFGLVGLEAMRAAKPVVAFAVGGIPDWLHDGENGLLAPPGDAIGLARHLDRLVADPSLREHLGAAGRAAFEKRWTMEHYVDRLVEAFEATLAEWGTRRCT